MLQMLSLMVATPLLYKSWNFFFYFFKQIVIYYSGSDAILLGAETLRGLYPVETISIVGKICAEVVFLPVCTRMILPVLVFLLFIKMLAMDDLTSRFAG
jgi:hypothetical protein